MPFHFTCPYCFKKTLVDEALAGQSGPCVNCGKTITVPQLSQREQPTAARPVDSRYVPAPSERPPKPYAAWAIKGASLLVIVIFLTSISVYLLWPAVQGLSITHDRAASLSNLQRIAGALQEYAQEYGSYPPPVVYGEDGRAMHSWRVLILAHLGYPSIYARYNFDEPWDSADNGQLLSQCPDVYVHPEKLRAGTSEVNYALITGPRTLFPPEGPLAPDAVPDGSEQTLLLVETDSGNFEWTKPMDIDVNKLTRRIGASGPHTIGGLDDEGAAAVFADGGPAWLPYDLSAELLDALITPDGAEPVEPAAYQFR